MSLTALALSAYIIWTLSLVLLLEACRAHLVLAKGRAANSFSADGSDVSPFLARITRAHANCYEHFPVIGGTLILFLFLEKTEITDPLAPWIIAMRILQSITHMVSGSVMAANIRFAFFFAQIVIVVIWLSGLV
ncbi:MAG: MAPEG family protein [Sneathiellales bacterium]|nr:MAPEG family protein [Sneathiellales bacterium]